MSEWYSHHNAADRVRKLEEIVAEQRRTIEALTVGTDGSTPAIVQLDRMEAQLTAERADAERYRLWRSKATVSEVCEAFGQSLNVSDWYDYPGPKEAAIDAAIAAALQATAQENQNGK